VVFVVDGAGHCEVAVVVSAVVVVVVFGAAVVVVVEVGRGTEAEVLEGATEVEVLKGQDDDVVVVPGGGAAATNDEG
jgi:hypothetical protein